MKRSAIKWICLSRNHRCCNRSETDRSFHSRETRWGLWPGHTWLELQQSLDRRPATFWLQDAEHSAAQVEQD